MSPTFERLSQMMNGYQASCVLGAAAELSLFQPMIDAAGFLSAEAIASQIQTDLRATVVLLDALTALKILEKKTDSYSVPCEFWDCLDENSPNTFLPMLRHSMACLRSWGQLGYVGKSGIPAPKQSSIRGPFGDQESFISAMNSIAVRVIPRLIPRMKEANLLSFRRMLDLGGASGSYTIAFLQELPEASATILDLPVTLPQAAKRLELAGLERRVALVGGDFYKMDYPKNVDFVWISAIIHQQNQEQTRQMFKKSFSALDAGGRIAIRDVFCESDRTGPFQAAFFAVNMLCQTAAGRVYSCQEVFDLLTECGFRRPRLAVAANDMSSIIVADK